MANGMRSHIYITLQAIQELPNSPLKTLLNSQKQAVISGSYFPDSGYAARDDYGELAHWEPYLNALLQHIREKFKGQSLEQGDAAQYVAFLMGAASHSMADQCFDTLFMARSLELDGDVDELDKAGDVFLVVWKKSEDPPEFWVPFEDAAKVFEQVGHTVKADTLKQGMSLARTGQLAVGLLAESDHERLKKKMPWAEKMYLDPTEPGALPYLARVIARYWQILWQRLHGDNVMDQVLLISQPGSQGTMSGVDPNSVTSQITFFFGYPLLKSTYTDSNLRVEQVIDNQSIPINISWWGNGSGANTLKLRPRSPWQFDTEYRVTLKTGLQNVDKQPLPSDYSFTFRTRTATLPNTEQSTEQTPNVSDAGSSPEPSHHEQSSAHPDVSSQEEHRTDTPETPQPIQQSCSCATTHPSMLWMFSILILLGWLMLMRNKRSYREKQGSSKLECSHGHNRGSAF